MIFLSAMGGQTDALLQCKCKMKSIAKHRFSIAIDYVRVSPWGPFAVNIVIESQCCHHRRKMRCASPNVGQMLKNKAVMRAVQTRPDGPMFQIGPSCTRAVFL
jgi:hypothetical protein